LTVNLETEQNAAKQALASGNKVGIREYLSLGISDGCVLTSFARQLAVTSSDGVETKEVPGELAYKDGWAVTDDN
jgi:hypothetical protein